MTEKEKFISEKMRVLVGEEKYSRPQAYAIAISYWNKKQQGGFAQQGISKANQFMNIPPTNNYTISNTYEEVPVGMGEQERIRLEQYSKAPQKPISRILQNVQTNEPKQGLPEGNYVRVDYLDKTSDYLTPQGYEDLRRMNNYRLFIEGQRKNVQQEGGMQYAQMGVFNNMPYDLNAIIQSQTLTPQQNFSQGQYALPSTPTFNKRDDSYLNMDIDNQQLYQPTQEDIARQGQQITESNLSSTAQTTEAQKAIQQSNVRYNDINRVNIMNPGGGISLDYALNYAGRGFGAGNPWQAGIGTGLSLLKGTRNFLTGFSEGKEDRRVAQEMMDTQFDRPRNYVWAQEGGKIKNSEVIAQNAITDNPKGTINLEDGEYVLRNNGQVQPVVGEPHIKDGKIAEGVNAQLNEGDKVLSDYVKLKAQDVKELKERYDISLKKGTTFAEAQKKLDQKLGINKLEEDKAILLEKSEKAASITDANARELSLNAIAKSIGAVNEKINTLSGVRGDNFNFLFERQEAQEKLGSGEQLFDKNGKEVTEVHEDVIAKEGGYAQMGGQNGMYIQQLAKKHNIPVERAMELIKMQGGGEMSQGQEQMSQEQSQILQMISESLQQGVSPDEIITALIKQEIPHEQAMSMVEQVVMQMQEQPQYAQEGYSFSTRYTPTVEGYDVQGKSVLDQDTLSDVEYMQPYTGKGYGAKMADVEKTMNLHSWYFDTEEKRNKFKEAIVKEGKQPEVEAFQKAYNEKLKGKAKEAGLKGEDVKNVIEKVGFTGKGVQQLDGKFGAFTSTRPLYDFSKKDGEVEAKVEDIVVTPSGETQKVQVRENVKNIMPNFEPYIPLFSPIQPIAKQEVDFQRIAPIKQTVEPMLAEQARQYQTEVDRIEQTGISPQQQEAILAQGLASSQMAANDAISKVETFNAQNQFQADQYNAGIQAKEQIMNAQMRDAYQDKMMATLANQEDSIRNQYRTQFLQGQADRNYITNLNKINTLSNQFAITPSGVEYLNNQPYSVPTNTSLNSELSTMSPEQRERYKAQEIAKKRMYAQMGLKR